ncbi:MAG: hypothetical protein J0H59_13765 [Comamonadaceae bacterium]|nr:hypothetical protein [Comamonadaceae bacterium]
MAIINHSKNTIFNQNDYSGSVNFLGSDKNQGDAIRQKIAEITRQMQAEISQSSTGHGQVLAAIEGLRQEMASADPRKDELNRLLGAINGASALTNMAAQIRLLLGGIF